VDNGTCHFYVPVVSTDMDSRYLWTALLKVCRIGNVQIYLYETVTCCLKYGSSVHVKFYLVRFRATLAIV